MQKSYDSDAEDEDEGKRSEADDDDGNGPLRKSGIVRLIGRRSRQLARDNLNGLVQRRVRTLFYIDFCRDLWENTARPYLRNSLCKGST